MSLIIIVLLIAALVSFIAATFNAKLGTANLVALGLACWVLAVILQTVH